MLLKQHKNRIIKIHLTLLTHSIIHVPFVLNCDSYILVSSGGGGGGVVDGVAEDYEILIVFVT